MGLYRVCPSQVLSQPWSGRTRSDEPVSKSTVKVQGVGLAIRSKIIECTCEILWGSTNANGTNPHVGINLGEGYVISLDMETMLNMAG